MFDGHTLSNIGILNFLTSTRKSQVLLIRYLKVQFSDLSKYDVMRLSNFLQSSDNLSLQIKISEVCLEPLLTMFDGHTQTLS